MLYLASPNKGTRPHQHLVYVAPPTNPPGMNGMVGESALEPEITVTEAGSGKTRHSHAATRSGNVIMLSEVNGHTHAVTDLPQSVSTEPEEDEDFPLANPDKPGSLAETELIANKLLQFQEAFDYERDSIERGQESVRFREGDQWDSSTYAELDSNGRAALTLNHVAPMIESLSGIYRQNRTDMHVFPTANGDEFIADVLTQCIKQIQNQNNFEYEEVLTFEDVIGPGRGSIECFPDFDTDPQGFLRIRYVPWDMILYGPHLRYDQSDSEYVFRWRWVSSRQLKAMYPKKAQEAGLAFDRFFGEQAGLYDMSDLDTSIRAPLFVNASTKEIRLLECEEKEFRVTTVYIDPTTGFSVTEAELPKGTRKQVQQLPLSRVDRRSHVIRRTVVAGSVLLDDLYPELPTPPNSTGPDFTIKTAYAYKRGSRFEGKIERAKDAQREINKRRSQIVDILNTCINNGWITEDGMFKSRAAFEQFKRDVSASGFVVTVADISRPPQKVESGQVQPGIVQLELASLQSFRDITNVNPQLLGVDAGGKESGIAIQLKQRQGLIGNEYLFDNMARLKRDLGRTLILWIKELYTPERIARLVLDQARAETVFLQGQPVDPNNQQFFDLIQKKLADADLLAYDVEVGESGSTPTAQMSNFSMLMEMARAGLPIPPEALIMASPLPNKEQIVQAIQQAKQAEAEKERQKSETEIRKTLIAKTGNASGPVGSGSDAGSAPSQPPPQGPAQGMNGGQMPR